MTSILKLNILNMDSGHYVREGDTRGTGAHKTTQQKRRRTRRKIWKLNENTKVDVKRWRRGREIPKGAGGGGEQGVLQHQTEWMDSEWERRRGMD